jgi:thymidylate kinase
MILALEGPDGSGKTTMFRALRDFDEQCSGCSSPACFNGKVTFVDFPSMGAKLWPFAQQIEDRDVKLFSSLYDSSKTYITDRFFATTGPVYARAFNRPIPDYEVWWPRVHVIYLAAPFDILVDRIQLRQMKDLRQKEPVLDKLSLVVKEYQMALTAGHYAASIIPSTYDIPVTEQLVKACIRSQLSN